MNTLLIFVVLYLLISVGLGLFAAAAGMASRCAQAGRCQCLSDMKKKQRVSTVTPAKPTMTARVQKSVPFMRSFLVINVDLEAAQNNARSRYWVSTHYRYRVWQYQ